jgi:ABC-type transport system involved in multi-copper enzyme maturation permease subunit
MATTAPLAIDTSATSRVPFGRLVLVEWRKTVDTRGGFWLLLITAGLCVLAVALTVLVVALNEGATVTAGALAEIMTIPISLLVPVLAVMTVTSEWGQRTAMVTFALEPHRLRVIAAKLVAVTALAVATMALAFVLGVVANLLCAAIAGIDPVWDLEASALGWLLVSQVLYFLMGFGLAMLLLNTPATIAIYYVTSLLLPLMVWGALYALFEWARDLLPWIDMSYALAPFQQGTDMMGQPVETGGLQIAQLVSAVTLWVLLPIVAGGWRLLRAELK